MTNPREPDSRLEDLLRSSLHGEAETISPSGDGLARIQQRTAARGRRLWLRPVAVVGGAAVAAVAGFTAYAVTSPSHSGSDSLLSKQPTVVPSTPQTSPFPTATTSSTPPPAGPVFPATAFYPFTSAAQEQSWEAQRGYVAQPWVLDPVASAKKFVQQYVQATDVKTVLSQHVAGKNAAITLGRSIADASSLRPVKVTTVQLQRFGKAWLVVAALDPTGYLKISSPSGGAHVASPVTVTGSAFGVEEVVHVDVATIGTRFSTSPGQAQFGNGTKSWSTSVAFAQPADPRGAVLVTENSLADSGTSRIVVKGVTFNSEQSGYPQYFYGIKNDRVTKFSSRTGDAISYLTAAEPGGGASDPQLVGDRVYYLSGSGTCTNALRYVPTSGGPSQPAGGTGNAWDSDDGYVITHCSVRDDKVSAVYETACDSGTTPAAKLIVHYFINDSAPATWTKNYASVPPGLVNDPSWYSDFHFDAIVRTGTQNSVMRLNADGAFMTNDGEPACAGYDVATGEPDATQVDANGYVWLATRTGSSMDVVRCIGSTARVMFTVAGDRQPADLSVAGSGGAALLTDIDGHVWRWTMGGNVTQLLPSVPVPQPPRQSPPAGRGADHAKSRETGGSRTQDVWSEPASDC